MGFSTSSCRSTGLSNFSNSMRLVISASSAPWSLPSSAITPLSSSLTERFWKVGVNDEIWATTTMDV